MGDVLLLGLAAVRAAAATELRRCAAVCMAHWPGSCGKNTKQPSCKSGRGPGTEEMLEVCEASGLQNASVSTGTQGQMFRRSVMQRGQDPGSARRRIKWPRFAILRAAAWCLHLLREHTYTPALLRVLGHPNPKASC